MANYNNLKNAIQSVIKANGNNEITGPILQAELLSMITTLGAGYQYMGVAQPSTNPGTPDARVMYLAYLPGTYVNFGGIIVTGFCVLKYDTVWTKEDIPISSGANFSTEPDDLTLEAVGNTNILKFANRSYNSENPNGMGYKILRNGLTFAEQVTDTNTVYEIRYDFDLNGGTHNIPAGCVLRFNGGSIQNGTLGLDNTLLIEPEFENLTLSGTIKNETLFSGWFKNIGDFIDSANALSGYVILEIKKGTYQTTKLFSLQQAGKITIKGNNATFNVGDATTFIMRNSTLAVNQFPELTLAQLPVRNDFYIYVTSVTGVNVGDTLLLRNTEYGSFNNIRDYEDGEFCVVTEIDSTNNKIKVLSPLCGVYSTLADCKVYIATLTDVEISDLNLVCTSRASGADTHAVAIRLCLSAGNIKNVSLNGWDLGVSLLGCFNVEIQDSKIVARNDYPAQNGNSYGVHVGNSQNVNVTNCYLYAGNHGISTGGHYNTIYAIPCRFVTVDNCYCYGYRSDFGGGIQAHGNIEYFNVRNSVTNGFEFGGDYILLENCEIVGNGEFKGIFFNEICGFNVKFVNNKFVDINIRMRRGTSVITPAYEKGNEEILFDNNTFIYQSTFVQPSGNVGYFYFNVLVVSNYANVNNVSLKFLNNVIKNYSANMVEIYLRVPAATFIGNFIRNMKILNQLANVAYFKNTIQDCVFTASSSDYAIDTITIEDNEIRISNAGFTRVTGYFLQVVSSGSIKVMLFNRNRVNYLDTISSATWPIRTYSKNTKICIFKENIVNFQGYNTKAGWIQAGTLILGSLNVISYDANYDYSQMTPLYYDADNVFGEIMQRDKLQSGMSLTKEIIKPIPAKSGTTAQRPTLTASDGGFVYYDTTLPKAIIWNGSAWVNMDGTPLS